ncbi:hypothetical protein SAMN04488121_107107 [Chitinophaga filiformis]|uniref:Uncharacterized protein n=1 Tax=Chitinophaga filiformis TaxID=104663 RepID=A0A1G7XWL2_CHIFI|nr:hypothetical protein SAMN04488121_107107 [Chitinophaga filiformis]
MKGTKGMKVRWGTMGVKGTKGAAILAPTYFLYRSKTVRLKKRISLLTLYTPK